MAIRLHGVRLVTTVLVLGVALTLGACAEKAKSIQIGANQFQASAAAAIAEIDELGKAEIAAPPQPESTTVALAAEFLLKGTGTATITEQDMNTATNINTIGTPAGRDSWNKFILELNGYYDEFDAQFTRLQEGSFFAASKVGQAEAPLTKLIAQMAAFAKKLGEVPAKFVVERSYTRADIQHVRDDTKLSEDAKLAKIEGFVKQYQDIEKREAAITREAIERSLVAVQIGNQLRLQLQNYDKLTIDDLMEGLTFAFAQASAISGRDFNGLQAKADKFVADLKGQGSDVEAVINDALDAVGERIETSLGGSETEPPAAPTPTS